MITGSVVTILVLVSLQSIVLAVAIIFLGRQLASLQEHTGKLGSKVSELLEQSDRLLENAEKLQAQVPAQLEKINRSLQWTRQKIGEVDHYAAQNLYRLTGQLEYLNRKSDDWLSGFSGATFRIHRAIINPTRHVAAALSAIQESVMYYLGWGRQTESEPAHPDDQIFI